MILKMNKTVYKGRRAVIYPVGSFVRGGSEFLRYSSVFIGEDPRSARPSKHRAARASMGGLPSRS